MRLALRSQKNAAITIIDPKKAIDAFKERHGTEKGCIFSVYDIVHKYGFELPRAYKGPTEWLVWGCVPREAIVATFHINDLRRLVSTTLALQEILHLGLIQTEKYSRNLNWKIKCPQHLSATAIGAAIRTLLVFLEISENYYRAVVNMIYDRWNLQEVISCKTLVDVVLGETQPEVIKHLSERLCQNEKEVAGEEEEWTIVHRSRDEPVDQVMSDCIVIQSHDNCDPGRSETPFRYEGTSREEGLLWSGLASSLESNVRLWPWPPKMASRVLAAPNSPTPVHHQKQTKHPRHQVNQACESEVRAPQSNQELTMSESGESPIVSKYWKSAMPIRSSSSAPVSHQFHSTPAISTKECTIIDLTQEDEDEEEDIREGLSRADLRMCESEWTFVENEDSFTEASFETAPED